MTVWNQFSPVFIILIKNVTKKAKLFSLSSYNIVAHEFLYDCTFNPQILHFSFFFSLASSHTFELKVDKPENHTLNKTVTLWH
jgi:hypothetical protein